MTHRKTTTKIFLPALLLMPALTGCITVRLPRELVRKMILPAIPEHTPPNPHALFVEGKGYLARGEAREACARFEAALREQPGFVEARLGLAHALREREAFKRARTEYKRVLAESPNNIQALRGLAIAEDRLGRPEEAEALLLRALGLAPEAVATLNAFAEFHYGRRDYRKALEYWDRSLRVDGTQDSVRSLVEDLRGYVNKYVPADAG